MYKPGRRERPNQEGCCVSNLKSASAILVTDSCDAVLCLSCGEALIHQLIDEPLP